MRIFKKTFSYVRVKTLLDKVLLQTKSYSKNVYSEAFPTSEIEVLAKKING